MHFNLFTFLAETLLFVIKPKSLGNVQEFGVQRVHPTEVSLTCFQLLIASSIHLLESKTKKFNWWRFSQEILNIIKIRNFKYKIVGFAADNTKTNYGGVSRKRGCNILTKLKQDLDREIIGNGCDPDVMLTSLTILFSCHLILKQL